MEMKSSPVIRSKIFSDRKTTLLVFIGLFGVIGIKTLFFSYAQSPVSSNPFGSSIDQTLSLPIRLQIAQSLKLHYVRPTGLAIPSGSSCADCESFTNAGYKLVWNVNNRPTTGPSVFPVDLNSYKNTISTAIDTYKPVVIAVENEANSLQKFAGTTDEYQQMLVAACQVAHSKGIKCASDGTVGELVTYYVFYHYYFELGDTVKASSYRDRAFQTFQMNKSPTDIQTEAQKYLPWLMAYKNSSLDYLNFHWYSEDGADSTANASGFSETVQVLKEVSGLDVITNETGQRDQNPDIMTKRMEQIVANNMPYAIWYSSDAGPNGPQALSNHDGSLRPHGSAFANFISTNYSNDQPSVDPPPSTTGGSQTPTTTTTTADSGTNLTTQPNAQSIIVASSPQPTPASIDNAGDVPNAVKNIATNPTDTLNFIKRSSNKLLAWTVVLLTPLLTTASFAGIVYVGFRMFKSRQYPWGKNFVR